ncbi:DUF3373 family protein [Geomesophilobacter sediminis]|uniref:DUF3373 domain-containing protein n=1 Tax=Geomesophilobacter sediminis TaxID=2798584 RepID=A0A8J7M2W8_9BACT|nr:DUF3373 family protein [Geomesophilobacter sediminis]MBJ6727740.1 DUF3373 domain-containing protein [Geomesophilobacter sediminis]
MNTVAKRLVLGAAIATLAAPAYAQADDQALQLKVDELSKKVQQLEEKSQNQQKELTRKVEKLEDKSLSKWLTIGGDYRFRFDSLRGQTAAFTDAMGTFNNAAAQLQGAFFADPTNPINAAMLSGLMNFSNQMQNTNTLSGARNFLGQASTQQMIGGLGNFAKQVPSYRPNNDSLYTNRLGLDLHAKATKDVTVNVRLLAYKVFGAQDDSAITNNGSAPFFADRTGVFDGTLGHVPSSSLLDVDRAYATWSNIGDQPVWFSVGRRPSTNGAPSNLRLNNPRPGNGGTPALLVDYAFDGMTLGYAPDIDALPGAYAKVCYGRGFESGFENPANSLNDTDMLGIAVIPIDTDPLRVWLQWNRGFSIFDFPTMQNTAFGNTAPKVNLGDIDWYGAGAMSTIKNVGPGKLNFFGDAGLSVTHPNNNVSGQAGFQGLMTGRFLQPEAPTDKTGWAAYVGARYDYEPSRTKVGLEYNHGSKNWITFAPSADDMWTSKLGTRGDVYEAYLIQELNLKPISSYLATAFFRLGYQYYSFDYTGSNNWVGAPVKISEVKSTDMMLLTPLKYAQDIYLTFEVKF